MDAAGRVLGAEHPGTLRYSDNLAYCLLKQGGGDAVEAERRLSALQQSMERVLGPEHPHTQRVRERLAEARAALDPLPA